MNEELKRRLDAVRIASQQTAITLDAVADDLQLHAKKICQVFELPYGSLIRSALAIKDLDGAESLQAEHLQEAAQHLLLKD
jgi:hypothetical protein